MFGALVWTRWSWNTSFSLLDAQKKSRGETLPSGTHPMTPAEVGENWLHYSGSRTLPRKQNLVETMVLFTIRDLLALLSLTLTPSQFTQKKLTLCDLAHRCF